MLLDGRDITNLSPDRRARLGLGHSFQDSRLFGSLTVEDVLKVALDQTMATRDPVAAALGFPDVRRAEDRLTRQVDELIGGLGLDAYREKFVSELSTGTRRIVDLACQAVGSPRVILFDEPSSGIAQREAEALGPMLEQIRDDTGASLLVIDHDMAVLASICDRMVALDLGAKVAEGTAVEVLEHPAVIASYLGGSRSAIERSGGGARGPRSRPQQGDMTRLESMRERAAATNSAARRSLVWMLLARQRGPVRAVLALIVLHSILALMIAQEVVELVDNGIVDQAAPIGPYVSHIAKLALLSFIVGFASRQMTARIGYQLEYDLRAWLYTRVQWADLRMPKQMATGQLVTRSMTDLKMVQTIIQFLPSIVTLAPATIVLLIYLAYLSFPLAVIASLALPLNLWFLSKFRLRLWGLSWADLNERAEVASAIDEPVRGVRVMRAFGREEHERERLGATALRAFRYSMTRVRLLARYDILLKAVPLLINALVLVAGAQLIAADQLSVGVFLVTFQVAGYVIAIAQLFDELASSWQFLRTAQGRLAEVISLGARPTEGRPAASRFESVELRDAGVSFAGTPVIDGLSFEARPGQLVAVSGPPGSGKSTLAGLIGGLVEPTSGEVLLDGRPLGEIDITTIRSMVRNVAEDPVLFSGSIRQNLDLGAAWSVSDDEINAALYAAGADDIVAGMPDGLGTHVGDRGLTLSGGQRQRLALARALVARPRVIVLDDALSAVNPSHEMEIIRRVAEFLPEAAIVAITRRPGPTSMADTVVELGQPEAPAPPAPVTAQATAPEQPGAGEAVSELMDVVHSLEVSEEAPIVSDAECRVDAMPRVRRLVGITLFALIAVLILLVVNSLAGLGPEILFAEATESAEDGETSIIYGIGLAVVAVGIVFAASGYFVRVLSMKIAQSIGYLLRRRVFERLTKLGIDFYDRELPGEVATRVVQRPRHNPRIRGREAVPIHLEPGPLCRGGCGGDRARAAADSHDHRPGRGDPRLHRGPALPGHAGLQPGARRSGPHRGHVRRALCGAQRAAGLRGNRQSQSPVCRGCLGAAPEPAVGDLDRQHVLGAHGADHPRRRGAHPLGRRP